MSSSLCLEPRENLGMAIYFILFCCRSESSDPGKGFAPLVRTIRRSAEI